jgi:hemerythrin-like domain-containing protein
MSEECRHHNCIEELRADHQKILKELSLLEGALKGSAVDKKQVENFLRFTEDFAEPHHHKKKASQTKAAPSP